jgi:predicted nuclease of predicted toxin-antitoxin system
VLHKIKLLIDECLHTSLVKVATDRQYEAYHVAHTGMSGLKDHELLPRICEKDFTFVTNNAVDFRRIFRDEPIHAGLVIMIPSVTPARQRALFAAVLDYVGDRDLVNRAIEIDLKGDITDIKEYEIPSPPPRRAPFVGGTKMADNRDGKRCSCPAGNTLGE